MRPVFSVVLATSALTFAATTPFDRRQSSGDDSSSFNVFAYGEGIGGLPMFSTGGISITYLPNTKTLGIC